jgi:hypothetical protein
MPRNICLELASINTTEPVTVMERGKLTKRVRHEALPG